MNNVLVKYLKKFADESKEEVSDKEGITDFKIVLSIFEYLVENGDFILKNFTSNSFVIKNIFEVCGNSDIENNEVVKKLIFIKGFNSLGDKEKINGLKKYYQEITVFHKKYLILHCSINNGFMKNWSTDNGGGYLFHDLWYFII